jgi:hypothetical protein
MISSMMVMPRSPEAGGNWTAFCRELQPIRLPLQNPFALTFAAATS